MVNETQRKLISQARQVNAAHSASSGSREGPQHASAAGSGHAPARPFLGKQFQRWTRNCPNRDGTRSPCGWGSGSHHYPQWPGRWAVHAAAPHMPAPAPPVQGAMRSEVARTGRPGRGPSVRVARNGRQISVGSSAVGAIRGRSSEPDRRPIANREGSALWWI
jgi:hypothetical protein